MISAMLNKLAMALSIVFLLSSSFRTLCTRPHFVKMWMMIKINSIAIAMMKAAQANTNQALRTLELSESLFRLFNRNKRHVSSKYEYADDIVAAEDHSAEMPSVPTFCILSMVSSRTMFMYSSNPVSLPSNNLLSFRE